MTVTKAWRLDRAERITKVNQLTTVIGNHGRKFFRSKAGNYARMEMDLRGRLWWIDEWRGSRNYLHYRYWGKTKFSNGGTLHSYVDSFKGFVVNGKPIPLYHFNWSRPNCDGDLWGYGQGMIPVRQEAIRLGITT